MNDAYVPDDLVRWEAIKNASMGWYESVARLADTTGILDSRDCCSLEVLKASKGVLSNVVKVGFIERGERFKSGKRKGERKWLVETEVFAYVTREQVATLSRKYEEETGCCHECESGQKRYGWSATEGTTWRKCHRCNGTGVAPTTSESST